MKSELTTKLNKLKSYLSSLESVVIAFSGGVDSTFLAKIALEVLGESNVLAITATSSTYPARELQHAEELAKLMGLKYKLIVSEELEIKDFAENSPDRCYFCKNELFCKLAQEAEKEGMNKVVDGSNLDDTADYRPGMKAAFERGVVSPLKEAGLTKDDIRVLSKQLGLPTWNKPAMACLSSRFPYGQQITKEKLLEVERAEELLHKRGFSQFRVRHHGHTARIEVMPEEFAKIVEFAYELNKEIKNIGFTYVALDLGGFRSGSMNETIQNKGAV